MTEIGRWRSENYEVRLDDDGGGMVEVRDGDYDSGWLPMADDAALDELIALLQEAREAKR